MKNRFAVWVLVAVAIVTTGCASRTKIVAGPLAVGGNVQVYDEMQPLDVEVSWGHFGWSAGPFSGALDIGVGPCTKIIAVEHATGDTEKVFADDCEDESDGGA